MTPRVLVAGLDPLALCLEAPLVQRAHGEVRVVTSVRTLLEGIATWRPHLAVLGAGVGETPVADAVRSIRGLSTTRHVSLIVVLPRDAQESEPAVQSAGANVVLRRPLAPLALDQAVAKLLLVPRRLDTRLSVQAQLVGTTHGATQAHFCAVTRNLSSNGLLLASPVALNIGEDLDIELDLPGALHLALLGRVVRESKDVGWPYRGYGVEFLMLSGEAAQTLATFVARGLENAPTGRRGIVSTVRRGPWIYEIGDPEASEGGWQVQIRRAARDQWRPGEAGPYYVVDGASQELAVAEARAFIQKQG